MSILYTNDDGWVISHLDYLHNIYNTVEDEHTSKTLKFNEALFNVNSQYLRQNQLQGNYKKQETPNSLKKQKRKKSQILSQDILEENYFVKEVGLRLLNSVKNFKLFYKKIIDNNEESRLESKKFYSNTPQLNCNFHGNNQKEIASIVKLQNEKFIFPKNCKFYCYDVKDIDNKFNLSEKFDLILLDPPWWNKSIRRKKKKFAESSYKMMYNEEITKIPIKNLLTSTGIVAVWCTNSSSQIKYILEEMFPAWNVIYKTKWYWLKITQNEETICDFNDKHGKQPYEQLIFGSFSSHINFNLPDKKIIISIPSAIHSHKPPLTEIFKCFLNENSKFMEIFARYLLPDWTSWGLEVLKFQHLSLYSVIETENNSQNKDINR